LLSYICIDVFNSCPEIFKYECVNISKVELNGISTFPKIKVAFVTTAKPSFSCCWKIVVALVLVGVSVGEILGIIGLAGVCEGDISGGEGNVMCKQGNWQVEEFHVEFNPIQLHIPSSIQEKLFGSRSQAVGFKERPDSKQVMLLLYKSNCFILVKLSMVDGILPLNWLLYKNNCFILVKLPMVDGILPLNWLSNKSLNKKMKIWIFQ